MSDKKGWIGVDFDGTLCVYDFGAPIPIMVERVKQWLRKGYEVRVFTSRVSYADEIRREDMRERIACWCIEHIGQRLRITNEKDFNMLELWDDKAITVVKNTGLSLREHTLLSKKRRRV